MNVQNTIAALAPLVLIAAYSLQPTATQDDSSPGEIALLKSGGCFVSEARVIAEAVASPAPPETIHLTLPDNRSLSNGMDPVAEQPVALTDFRLCGSALMRGQEEGDLTGSLWLPLTLDSHYEATLALDERVAQIVRILELMEIDPENVPLERRIELIERVIAHVSPK